ncbi:hypothetical protein L2E82_33538 [Cichorium intybus]|uniref:Uncharacterized protein n=1 Tax=Cichorium intybus TaxID=13427 RepID=A0ACB9BKT8_CICIN|nr:hypothetical protein L2E82_33538 [Cichorium intybus]
MFKKEISKWVDISKFKIRLKQNPKVSQPSDTSHYVQTLALNPNLGLKNRQIFMFTLSSTIKNREPLLGDITSSN